MKKVLGKVTSRISSNQNQNHTSRTWFQIK